MRFSNKEVIIFGIWYLIFRQVWLGMCANYSWMVLLKRNSNLCYLKIIHKWLNPPVLFLTTSVFLVHGCRINSMLPMILVWFGWTRFERYVLSAGWRRLSQLYWNSKYIRRNVRWFYSSEWSCKLTYCSCYLTLLFIFLWGRVESQACNKKPGRSNYLQTSL